MSHSDLQSSNYAFYTTISRFVCNFYLPSVYLYINVCFRSFSQEGFGNGRQSVSRPAIIGPTSWPLCPPVQGGRSQVSLTMWLVPEYANQSVDLPLWVNSNFPIFLHSLEEIQLVLEVVGTVLTVNVFIVILNNSHRHLYIVSILKWTYI